MGAAISVLIDITPIMNINELNFRGALHVPKHLAHPVLDG